MGFPFLSPVLARRKYILWFFNQRWEKRRWWGHKCGLYKEGINGITGCDELAYITEVWDKKNTWLSGELKNSVIWSYFLWFGMMFLAGFNLWSCWIALQSCVCTHMHISGRKDRLVFLLVVVPDLCLLSAVKAKQGPFCCYNSELRLLPKLIRSTRNNYSFKIVLKFKYPEVETSWWARVLKLLSFKKKKRWQNRLLLGAQGVVLGHQAYSVHPWAAFCWFSLSHLRQMLQIKPGDHAGWTSPSVLFLAACLVWNACL